MWVLIVVFLSGYGSRPVVTMQEFNTRSSCEQAAQVIRKNWKDDLLRATECVSK